MTIKPLDFQEPAQSLSDIPGKRKTSDDLNKAMVKKQDSKQEQKNQPDILEIGPFKGLPIPFQKKHYESSLPYISCNEKGQEATLRALTENPPTIAPERRVHIGFSVWFNLDLMAVTKPSYAILCDFDNKIMTIYQGISDCLAHSTQRREFVNNFGMFLNQNSEDLLGLPSEEVSKMFNILDELNRTGSWLASEESFQVIKKLSQQGHILFLNLDITDTQGAFVGIKKWLDVNHFELDTLYASNIIDWLKDALKQQAYILNMKTVSTENTRFIQAYAPPPTRSKGPKPKHEPTQYIVKGIDNMKLPPKNR
jgi:hypothetical protein